MDEYMEVFDYDNSEPEDAWWNESQEIYDWVPGEELQEPETEFTDQETESADQEPDIDISKLIDGLLEKLVGSQNYGSMGDYYDTVLGCYIFPNYEVYEYFIDIDAVGDEWAEASDGHYILSVYLEDYEGYKSGNGEEEEQEEAADVLPSETETEILETLESIRGLLSVIKMNESTYYDAVLGQQTEMLENQERSLAISEGTLYGTIVSSVLLAVIAGEFLSHAFFGRMRAG